MPPNELENNNEIPKDVKFEARGFRKEEPEEETEEQELVGGMPQDGQALTAEDADAAMLNLEPADEEEGSEEGEPAAPKKEAKIKIGTREFDNQEDAFAYAAELEQEKIAADAFRQGVEVASAREKGNGNSAPVTEPDELENFESEFYADPKKYLKDYGQKVTEKTIARIDAQKATQEKNTATWAKFKTDYPDLAGPDEFADVQTYILRPDNWENLKHMDTDKAFKIAAEAVRGKYDRILKNKAPGLELTKAKTPSSPGNGISVTVKEKEEPGLNFVAQTRQWKAKRTARPPRR